MQTNFRRREIDRISRSSNPCRDDSSFAKKVVGCQTNPTHGESGEVVGAPGKEESRRLSVLAQNESAEFSRTSRIQNRCAAVAIRPRLSQKLYQPRFKTCLGAGGEKSNRHALPTSLKDRKLSTAKGALLRRATWEVFRGSWPERRATHRSCWPDAEPLARGK